MPLTQPPKGRPQQKLAHQWLHTYGAATSTDEAVRLLQLHGVNAITQLSEKEAAKVTAHIQRRLFTLQDIFESRQSA